MVESPEIVNSIFQQILSFYIEYENRILEAAQGKIDILVTGDDFGMQNGLMISPSMWKEMLEKGHVGRKAGQGFYKYDKPGGKKITEKE